MSTRCQVIVKDGWEEVWFYRHSDGYPDGTLPTLEKFLQWVKDGKIRDNAEQASGWLVMIGAEEYAYKLNIKTMKYDKRPLETLFEPSDDTGRDWKVGAYEPCAPVKHGDIEYLYTVDLKNKTITWETV